jgi:hypothetical protein
LMSRLQISQEQIVRGAYIDLLLNQA